VGLAYAGRPEQVDVVGALDEAQPGELPGLLAIDRGLELEIELIQRLHPGQPSEPEPALDAPLMAAAPLGFERLWAERMRLFSETPSKTG
jgi:hypothetical protein